MTGKRILVTLTLLVAVVLLNLPLPVSMRVKEGARDQIAPFQNVMSLVLRKGSNLAMYWQESGAVADQARVLHEELARLRYEVQELRVLREENEQLRRQLAFRRRAGRRLVPAEVVARDDMSGWWHTVRLNVGRTDGVGSNMAVITTEGLVGRITEVSDHTADVLLITDSTSRVACKFSQAGTFGMVEGRGVSFTGRHRIEILCSPRPLGITYISKNAEIRQDDTVVTSGLGGIYPAGLLVGDVRAITPDVSGLYQRAEVVPASDLAELRYAFVVVE